MTIEQPIKLTGYEFYKSIGSPRHILAPMVDQSELAFRVLCKRYNTHLTYTPMFHSKVFIDHIAYRQKHWQVSPDEGPLIVQFCGNEPEIVLEATRACMNMEHARDIVCAFDLNLGCPQRIAQRGRYGSFLMEEQPLIRDIVSTLHRECEVPVTCKIRIFPDVQHTIQYAIMLRDSGCQMLAVHGRTRDQKGQKQGLADWEQIKMVREVIRDIPVLANGNIRNYDDVEECVKRTGVDGVMSACGLLDDPSLFDPTRRSGGDGVLLAREYLDITGLPGHDPPNISYVKSHIFKMMSNEWTAFTDLRDGIQDSGSKEEIRKIIDEAYHRKIERPHDWKTYFLQRQALLKKSIVQEEDVDDYCLGDALFGRSEEQKNPTKSD